MYYKISAKKFLKNGIKILKIGSESIRSYVDKKKCNMIRIIINIETN